MSLKEYTRTASPRELDDASRTGQSDLQLDYVMNGNFQARGGERLYVAGDRAFNQHDAGNYLWGRSMKILKVNYLIVKAASEFNAFYNGKLQYPYKRNGEKIENLDFNRISLRRLTLGGDSNTDQRAIRKGYFRD